MIYKGKQNILGILIDAIDYDAAIWKIISAAQQDEPLAVSALAVHGVMTGVMDPEHRYRLNEFEMLVPDGQPVRWALNILHRTQLAERVYGPELMLRVCRTASEQQVPIFLYGSEASILEDLEKKLKDKFPEIRIAGKEPSKFRKLDPDEEQEVIARIKGSGAKITFVGLGCPRQEVFAYELRQALSMPVIAVGAAFTFHAGKLAQAPKKMQDWGLEWFFRFLKEPRRLWKRYMMLNPYYLSLLFLQLMRFRKFDPSHVMEPAERIRYG